MAPLPDNNTMRVWIDYTSGGRPHSVMFRFAGDDPSGAAIQPRLTEIGAALQGVMDDEDSITGWRFSLTGQNFSFPFLGPVGGAGLLTGGVVNPESQACFVGASGRSSGGRRVHCNIFTIAATGFTVYRQNRGSLAANFAALYDVLTDQPGIDGDPPIAIDGLPIVWNDYLNIGQNAYYQRASR